ncbi:MAG: transaldolase [Acidimicrobiaceae bacterium]|jgi:transaldolase|nr:transaldolase [Acidimicrobiaceae bacterium]MDQ1365874.1 transaldolase [Acidimicrobiaceae bacterium]MDQ1442026.1 transaldolase [Acidimicrobiaceae bacterium]
MTDTRLHQLFAQQGQSPWIDNLMRSYLTTGRLQELVAAGIRGVTSNPTIFQKAIEGSADYDDDFRRLTERESVDDAYWDLVVDDVTKACGVLRPLYDQSGGGDGYVSLEVAPSLARDTAGTIEAARNLHQRINLPNLMVKIPATAEGVPAIQQMISEGRNINVTLIFSLGRYDDVIEAYLEGLEAWVGGGGDPTQVHSVASFFVSRVDTEVDRRLDKVGEKGQALRGKAAIAQAKLAYQHFEKAFSGDRWATLRAQGAHRQRPLWASTSTKNPAFPDLYYVENLIGPHTVDTMPDATVAAFLDHGVVARTIDQGVDQAKADLAALGDLGIDMHEVAVLLEDEGVASFAKSFDELQQALTDKASQL